MTPSLDFVAVAISSPLPECTFAHDAAGNMTGDVDGDDPVYFFAYDER